MNREDSSLRELTRLHVYELRIGMRVCRLEITNADSPYMFDQIEIKTQSDIQSIQAICDYVYIDVRWQKKYTGAIPTKYSNTKSKIHYAQAFNNALNDHKSTTNLIKTAMDDIRFGNQINTDSVKKAVSSCVEAVLHSPDVMSLLTQLKERDEYTSQHSMNVCVLSILLGRELNLSIDELNNLGLCGLMHDIGKAKVPLEILNKPGRLEEPEMDVMKKHTIYGRDILMSARNIFPGAVDVAHNHHEHPNGMGYPRRLNNDSLSMFTKIVTVVDTYDAITSNRCYKDGKTHISAISILVKGINSQFESKFVTQFINCIGFYPQGNLVELSSGEVAIVVAQNKKDKLKPQVLIILDKDKKKCQEKLLNLSDGALDANEKPYKIRQLVNANDFNISVREYLESGVFNKEHPVIQ